MTIRICAYALSLTTLFHSNVALSNGRQAELVVPRIEDLPANRIDWNFERSRLSSLHDGHVPLLLVERNPLEDVGAASRPVGVMVNGDWYTRGALNALHDF